jgi:CubicO group peptidase (beta-lactamase class C family)
MNKFLILLTLSIAIEQSCFSQTKDEIATRIDDYVRPYVESNNFSGSILVSKGKKILFKKAYGYANLESKIPNQASTAFHIASVSKTFTATGIMILEQRGLLTTSDLLSKYIPDFSLGDRITIHHLLTHTSGITNVNNLPEYAAASQIHQTPATLIDLFKNKPLDFQPGEKYSYSNSNYNVLAYIIEKVSGKTYGDFLMENIFKPLKMSHTFHHDNVSQIIPDCATGYVPEGLSGLQKSPFLDWSSKTGNGSLVTTTEDLLKWAYSFQGTKILSEKSKAKMFTQYGGSGYGWFLKTQFNKNCTYMNGRSPGFTSYLGMYPDENICIIVLSNNYVPVASVIGNDLAGILLNESIESPVIKNAKVPLEESKLIVGRYQFGKDFYRPDFVMEIKEQEGNIISSWGELFPGKPFEFINRTYWSKITFIKDKTGKIIQMNLDNFSGSKIE